MHRYWLQIAINLCGSRARLAQSIGVPEARITYWLNHARAISLENAIKIEKAVDGKVSRLRLIATSDRSLKRQLIEESELLKKKMPTLSLKEQVELGLAHEHALGDRKGVRSDLLLRENFPEVEASELPKRGRTEQIAAKYAGFGNYKTYHQAKRIVQNGVPELLRAVDIKNLPISRAALVAEYPKERQHELLMLDRKAMIQALKQNTSEKMNSTPQHQSMVEAQMGCGHLCQVPIVAWVMVSMIGGLNLKKWRVNNEQNQNGETRTVSTRATI